MKKFNLGQTLGILANAGVIAGIVFLSLEIRQNSAQIRSQAAYSINQSVDHRNPAIRELSCELTSEIG